MLRIRKDLLTCSCNERIVCIYISSYNTGIIIKGKIFLFFLGGDDQSLQNSEHENKDVTEKKCVKQIIGNNHSLGKKSKRKTSGLWEKAEEPHLKKGKSLFFISNYSVL